MHMIQYSHQQDVASILLALATLNLYERFDMTFPHFTAEPACCHPSIISNTCIPVDSLQLPLDELRRLAGLTAIDDGEDRQ